jgi:hypothetical protein
MSALKHHVKLVKGTTQRGRRAALITPNARQQVPDGTLRQADLNVYAAPSSH